MIVALASHLKGPAINTYTIRVNAPDFDDSTPPLSRRGTWDEAPVIQEFRNDEALNSYPQLIEAAESPVIDTSCAALLLLARAFTPAARRSSLPGKEPTNGSLATHGTGGQGAWVLDALPGVRLSDLARHAHLTLNKVPQFPPEMRARTEKGHRVERLDRCLRSPGAFKLRFYAAPMREILRRTGPWSDLN